MNLRQRLQHPGLIALGLLLLLALGSTALHQRAKHSETAKRAPPQPVPVISQTVQHVAGFTVWDRFVGRIEPAQQGRLAFERAGLVASIRVDEGDVISQGAIIATLDTALLLAEQRRVEGLRKEIRSRLALARLLEERQRTLQRQGHVSEQLLDEARLNSAALVGGLAAIEARLESLQLDIDKSVLRAPFSGIVGSRPVDVGVVVNAGSTVIELLETGRPQARIGVSPEAAATLRPGDSVSLHYRQAPLLGKIAAIRPDISPATRTVGVLIDLAQVPTGSFGDTVELRVARQITTPGFWVPLAALSEGEKGLWTVLTLQPQGDGASLVGREVIELLYTDGEQAFVRGTLRDAQQIIAQGRHRVIPGQRVAPGSAEPAQ